MTPQARAGRASLLSADSAAPLEDCELALRPGCDESWEVSENCELRELPRQCVHDGATLGDAAPRKRPRPASAVQYPAHHTPGSHATRQLSAEAVRAGGAIDTTAMAAVASRVRRCRASPPPQRQECNTTPRGSPAAAARAPQPAAAATSAQQAAAAALAAGEALPAPAAEPTRSLPAHLGQPAKRRRLWATSEGGSPGGAALCEPTAATELLGPAAMPAEAGEPGPEQAGHGRPHEAAASPVAAACDACLPPLRDEPSPAASGAATVSELPQTEVAEQGGVQPGDEGQSGIPARVEWLGTPRTARPLVGVDVRVAAALEAQRDWQLQPFAEDTSEQAAAISAQLRAAGHTGFRLWRSVRLLACDADDAATVEYSVGDAVLLGWERRFDPERESVAAALVLGFAQLADGLVRPVLRWSDLWEDVVGRPDDPITHPQDEALRGANRVFLHALDLKSPERFHYTFDETVHAHDIIRHCTMLHREEAEERYGSVAEYEASVGRDAYWYDMLRTPGTLRFESAPRPGTTPTYLRIPAEEATVVDCFCGAGLTTLGFTMACFRPVCAIEKHGTFFSSFVENFAGALPPSVRGAPAACQPQSLAQALQRSKSGVAGYPKPGAVAHLHASPPCQALSTSNSLRNLAAVEAHVIAVVDQLLEAIEHWQPKTLSLEEVAGFFITKLAEGPVRPWLRLSAGLIALGYQFDWRLLLATQFGAANHRPRCWMLGARTGYELPQPPQPRYSTLNTGLPPLPTDLRMESSLGKTLCWKGLLLAEREGLPAAVTVREAIWDLPRLGSSTGHTRQHEEGGPLSRFAQWARQGCGMLRYHHRHKGAAGQHRHEWDAPTATVCTKEDQRKARCTVHPEETRRLTVQEKARLQGIPDSFCLSGNLGEQYTQVGNAVPPPVAFEIAAVCFRALTGRGPAAKLPLLKGFVDDVPYPSGAPAASPAGDQDELEAPAEQEAAAEVPTGGAGIAPAGPARRSHRKRMAASGGAAAPAAAPPPAKRRTPSRRGSTAPAGAIEAAGQVKPEPVLRAAEMQRLERRLRLLNRRRQQGEQQQQQQQQTQQQQHTQTQEIEVIDLLSSGSELEEGEGGEAHEAPTQQQQQRHHQSQQQDAPAISACPIDAAPMPVAAQPGRGTATVAQAALARLASRRAATDAIAGRTLPPAPQFSRSQASEAISTPQTQATSCIDPQQAAGKVPSALLRPTPAAVAPAWPPRQQRPGEAPRVTGPPGQQRAAVGLWSQRQQAHVQQQVGASPPAAVQAGEYSGAFCFPADGVSPEARVQAQRQELSAAQMQQVLLAAARV